MLTFTKLLLSAALVSVSVPRQVTDSSTVSTPPMQLAGERASMTLVALGLLGMTVSDRRRRRRDAKPTGAFWVRFF